MLPPLSSSIDAVSALSGCTSQNSNGVLSLLGSSHASSCRAGMPSTSSRSDGTTVSGGVEVMGDLELFLMGLQLSELIPKFRLHKVEFAQLLSMTDHDLQMIGVDKVSEVNKVSKVDKVSEVIRVDRIDSSMKLTRSVELSFFKDCH